MHRLELETAMEPIEPLGAVDVHSCAKLMLRERFGGSKVCGGHAPVRKSDLNVEDDGDDVRCQDKSHAVGPRG